MRKIVQILLSSLFLTMLQNCALFDSGSDTVVDDYEVIWIDLHENRALYRGGQLVPPYVFAAGHDSKYIFAKQHPLLKNSEEIIDKGVTNYYIIERTEESFQDKRTFGPLNKFQFKKMCRHLKIENPEFDLTYPTDLKF